MASCDSINKRNQLAEYKNINKRNKKSSYVSSCQTFGPEKISHSLLLNIADAIVTLEKHDRQLRALYR